MRYLVGVTPSSWTKAFVGALAAGGMAFVGCQAGTTTDFSDGGSGSGGGNAQGSTGNGFSSGNGTESTGAGMGCSDADCIGSAQQGNCDSSLALAGSDAMDGARAIGLCQQYTQGGWGVTKAEWVRSDGSPLGQGDGGFDGTGDLQLGKGILTGFGPNVHPREGQRLLALSSGSARQPSDQGYYSVSGYWKDSNPDNPPPGYPKESPSCPGVITGDPYDSAGLKVSIHTPKDAKSISYNLDFYTYEFPNYICSQYNDFFVALLDPKPANLTDGNISFDSQGNLISVNAGFLVVCDAQQAGGKNFPCPQGYSEIVGTGFDEQMGFGGPNGSAATGWLETKAPVPPSSDITIQFSIWDSGDGVLDSTVLIDNFKFEVDETQTGTTPVPS